jgi:hypothetical protein
MSVDTEQHPESIPGPLPPDPAEYDSARAKIARAKGLEAPYIAGGQDPDPAAGLEEERHYGKLLLWMVLALMLGGFVIGIALTLVFGTAL